MTLNSFLKVNLETRYSVIWDETHGFETWKIDYKNRHNEWHYDKIHYIDSPARLPKEALKAKVLFVSINRATGALDISIK